MITCIPRGFLSVATHGVLPITKQVAHIPLTLVSSGPSPSCTRAGTRKSTVFRSQRPPHAVSDDQLNCTGTLLVELIERYSGVTVISNHIQARVLGR